MKKDAYYFPHFCNARHDRKLKRIRKDHGNAGYGIFFMVLEVLREQTDFRYPVSDIDILADEVGASVAILNTILYSYDLFCFDNDSFFSPKLIFFLQPYIEKSERARFAANLRWNNANAQQMLCTSNASKVNKTKLNESEVNQSKENESKENSSEPYQASELVILEIPLIKRDGFYLITESMIKEWEDTFPAVDIMQDLKNMRAWCIANPTKNKTKQGALKFITQWLTKTQNNGGNKVKPTKQGFNPKDPNHGLSTKEMVDSAIKRMGLSTNTINTEVIHDRI